MTDPMRVGVVGVGSMGANHARVYDELADATLVGVADADADRAAEVAASHDTTVRDRDALLDRADAVSVAVPTPLHADVLRDCFDAGVHALVEKPFVADPEEGRELAAEALTAGVTVQVGHIERFNPAVQVLDDILADDRILGIHARRLGPPVDRDRLGSVVADLMIHDIDIVNTLVDAPVTSVCAESTADGQHATATLRFDGGPMATLTASRVTQRKIRRLDVVTESRFVSVDYLDQSVEVFRRSVPEFLHENSDVSYRHESIVERPMVERVEPLKAEIDAFLDAIRTDDVPPVPPRDGVEALRIANEVGWFAGLADENAEVEA